MPKPNFFAGIDALNCLLHMDFEKPTKDIDLTLDLVELPFWFSFQSDEKTQTLKVYTQMELYNKDENMASERGSMVLDRASGEASGKAVEEIGENLTQFFVACQKLSCLIQEKGLEPLLKDLDPEKAGVLLTENDGELSWKVVTGRERPSLAVQTLFGGTTMARPYMDDFLERSVLDDLSIEEKTEAAEDGNVTAMEELAMLYLNGDEDQEIEPDPEKSVYWFQKAADAGDATAMYNLGLHYAKGHGVKRDFVQAAEWMQMAADAGDEDASELVEKYQNLAKAVAKAESGDAQAQADLAKGLMELGGSLEQAGAGDDYAESVKWAEKAAEQGNADAMWVLALAYEHGRGIDNDLEKASEYYRRGAEQGHAACQNSLGCMYLNGKPMARDMKTGYHWLLRSAEQGNAQGMYNLARCYQFGHGVQEDMGKAIEWYEKANEQLQDPQLAMKIGVFKHIQEQEPHKEETASLPEGYMKALEKTAAEFETEDKTLVKYKGTDAHVTLPFGLKEIGSRAFVINDHLESVEIVRGFRTIGEKAFMGCHSLHSVILPDTLETIGDYGFANCERIEQIELPESLTTIGECAFTNCTGLRHIVIPKGVKVIGSGAFSFCSGLESVVLPEGLTTIEHDAFADCPALKEMNFPSSLTQIGERAFSGCDRLPNAPGSDAGKKTADREEMEECGMKPNKTETVTNIDFGGFFSVIPEDGLMVAMHQKTEYEEEDVVAELFNTGFGREVELGLFGGFQNGVEISLRKKADLTAEQIEQLSEKVSESMEILVKRDRLTVAMKDTEAEGIRARLFLFLTQRGLLNCGIDLDSMSSAEADSYRRMFATALPVGAEKPAADDSKLDKGDRRRRRQDAVEAVAEKSEENLTTEGERLFAGCEKEKEEIVAAYRREMDRVFQRYNNPSLSEFGAMRSSFQEAINDAGRKLSRCVRRLSDDGEKLVQRGADVAFIRKMIDNLRQAQEDLTLPCNINLGDLGEWNLSFSVPNDVKALPQKWESILNNHPDIAAERLKAAREAETKRVNRIIDELKKKISKLKAEETPRRQASRTAEDEFRQSASTLEKRIAEVNALYDSRIREDEGRQDSLNHQREDCERQIQQTRAELDKAFFLAFGKKKMLQGKLDELNQQIRQMDQQIGDLGKSIDDARRNEAQELESIEQKHANLKEAMEHAQAHLEQLPAELAQAQEALADAQKQLERIPEMTLAELSVKPKHPAAMEEPKEQPAAAQAMGDEETQARIIAVLAGASSLTISEIISSDPALKQVSYMKVSTIVRRLVSEGILIREEYMQNAYFRLR